MFSASARSRSAILALAGATAFGWIAQARAQTAMLFPSGVAGYDQELGVTVQSRLRPQYDPDGVRVGSFVIRPELDQTLFNNSSVNGTPGSGSWGSQTGASVAVQSDWARDSLGGTIGVDHQQFFDLADESYTDWNVGLGGGYTLGDHQLTAAYSHQAYHQLGTAIGSIQSEAPVLDQTDTARFGYEVDLGRFEIMPDLSLSAYRFGDATVDGATFNQDFLNRDVIEGGVTTRFTATGSSGVIVMVRGMHSQYVTPQRSQPSNNSTSFQALVGVDYQAVDVWRYSVLAGIETRSFEAPQYSSRTAPIIEASAVWSPTAVLTLTGTLSRIIQDPETASTAGYILTQGSLVLDYELRRDVLLQGRTSVQDAQYMPSGSQANVSVGGGITWLVNRNVRLSLNEDYTTQSGPGGAGSEGAVEARRSGQYDQNLAALAVRVAF